jgi:hypothetical protein
VGVVTTKKVFIIIGSVLAALTLLVAIFVGSILGLAFYTIGHSEAARTAKSFLRQNEKLKREIGEVNGFGRIVTGELNGQNANGTAQLHLKVIGARQIINDVSIELMYQSNQGWRVTDAFYQTDAGATVDLLESDEQNAAPQ